MTLTDERRKALTLYLGECWHGIEDKCLYGARCDKCGDNLLKFKRTFDNRNDLMDLYEAIEKDGKWFSYEEKLFDNYKLGSYGGLYIPWLFCLDKDDYQDRCKMVAKFYGWEEKK